MCSRTLFTIIYAPVLRKKLTAAWWKSSPTRVGPRFQSQNRSPIKLSLAPDWCLLQTLYSSSTINQIAAENCRKAQKHKIHCRAGLLIAKTPVVAFGILSPKSIKSLFGLQSCLFVIPFFPKDSGRQLWLQSQCMNEFALYWIRPMVDQSRYYLLYLASAQVFHITYYYLIPLAQDAFTIT